MATDQVDYALIVLGGGCAGLSLAVRLAELGAMAPRTLVVEARTGYVNDRTWCFWRTAAHRYDTLIDRTWPAVRVRTRHATAVARCPTMPYQRLRADRFYDDALARISGSAQVRLCRGCDVTAVDRVDGNRWRVDTTQGVLTARWLVDTRPQPPRTGGARLWQSFLGREVEVAHAAFDPALVDLMDFSAAGGRLPIGRNSGYRDDRIDGGRANGRAQDLLATGRADAERPPHPLGFSYVLPLSPTRALVEYTVFAPEPLGAATLAPALAQAIASYSGAGAAHTLREEHGILPMGMNAAAPPAQHGYVRAGATAGGARPATGYAFQRLQRWADACAQTLARGLGPVSQPPDGRLTAWMDRLFLTVITRDPAQAPDLFVRLFQRVPPARLIRFLSDVGSLRDGITVAAALPSAPFLHTLLRRRKSRS